MTMLYLCTSPPRSRVSSKKNTSHRTRILTSTDSLHRCGRTYGVGGVCVFVCLFHSTILLYSTYFLRVCVEIIEINEGGD